MGRKLSEVLASLPEERQQRIEALAQIKVREMLASAKTLAGIRKAAGKTQVEVARALGVKQNAISQLEKRSDTYLSTFTKFLKGMGMHLEFAVVTADGARVDLSSFQPWEAGAMAAAKAPLPALVKSAVRNARVVDPGRNRPRVARSGTGVTSKNELQAKAKRTSRQGKIQAVRA